LLQEKFENLAIDEVFDCLVKQGLIYRKDESITTKLKADEIKSKVDKNEREEGLSNLYNNFAFFLSNRFSITYFLNIQKSFP
jgi:hypothetical protein